MTDAPQQQYVESIDVPLLAPPTRVRPGRRHPILQVRHVLKARQPQRILVDDPRQRCCQQSVLLLAVLAGVNDANVASVIALGLLFAWTLATPVPGVALVVRRLHDANYSGWMALLGLIPLAGGIILLVFVLTAPKPEG